MLIGTEAASRLSRFKDRVADVTRQALTDPVFAKSLLEKLQPQTATGKGQNAMVPYWQYIVPLCHPDG